MPRGGADRGQGAKPKLPQDKGILLKACPPRWLRKLVEAEAQATGKSLSEIVTEALKRRYEHASAQQAVGADLTTSPQIEVVEPEK